MKNVCIDYESLSDAKTNLNNLIDKVHPSYVNKLKPLYEELLKLDDNHDNCCSNESENLYSINDGIGTINKKITGLTEDIFQVNNQFVEAELDIIDSLKIFGEEYKLNELKIESKGLGIGFINYKDYYDNNLSKLYNNKKDSGPLTEEEFKSEQAILSKLLASGRNEREKAIIYATYIATLYPNKLNYFWGGGHYKTEEGLKGIDSNWGYPKLVTSPDNETTGTMQKDAMDCSGFVTRALVNGGYKKIPQTDGYYDANAAMIERLGETTSINDLHNVKSGDIVTIRNEKGTATHIGIIIDKDNKSNKMTVAHSSGTGGMNVTTINMKDGKVLDDSNSPDRIGNVYFTNVTRLKYEDE